MVDGRVDVVERDGMLVVVLALHNRHARPAYLPRELVEDDELFGPYFDLRDDSGAALGYIGPKVKRAADDLLALGGSGQLSHTIDISRAYAFLPGSHVYTLQIADGVGISAPAVRFTYTCP